MLFVTHNDQSLMDPSTVYTETHTTGTYIKDVSNTGEAFLYVSQTRVIVFCLFTIENVESYVTSGPRTG